MLLPCLSRLHLFTRLFASFRSLSPTLVFRLVCLPTLASSKHCQRFSARGREREREREAKRESEEQVPGCFVGITVKRSTKHGTRRPFSRAHFKACFALVLSTFGRGEERSEGGAAFERRWVFTHCLSCRCSL